MMEIKRNRDGHEKEASGKLIFHLESRGAGLG
jgi:hypothetical protein